MLGALGPPLHPPGVLGKSSLTEHVPLHPHPAHQSVHSRCVEQVTPSPCSSHFHSKFVQSLFLCFICRSRTLIPAVLMSQHDPSATGKVVPLEALIVAAQLLFLCLELHPAFSGFFLQFPKIVLNYSPNKLGFRALSLPSHVIPFTELKSRVAVLPPGLLLDLLGTSRSSGHWC